MIYFVDFDGTIFPNTGTEPHPDCVSYLNYLKSHNHYIFIYSCRSNPNAVDDVSLAEKHMIDFLNKHKIPYDGIIPNKPVFNYIIDDRALGIPLTSDYSVDWSRLPK